MDRDTMKKTCLDWWGRLRRKDTVVRLLLWLGVAGVLLIALSEWMPRRQSAAVPSATLTGTQVEQALEQRITDLLRQVEGVGACRVMVTLESGEQAVYAADTVRDSGGSISENYLMVDTADGPVGLLITRLQPTVKGVAVVCAGGGNDAVRQRVIQVVSTAFHISERRVCVVQQE